jgi:hypothetical protein
MGRHDEELLSSEEDLLVLLVSTEKRDGADIWYEGGDGGWNTKWSTIVLDKFCPIAVRGGWGRLGGAGRDVVMFSFNQTLSRQKWFKKITTLIRHLGRHCSS